MTVGERIKLLRKEKGISVDKLAELIGKDRATIYRYESKDIGKASIDYTFSGEKFEMPAEVEEEAEVKADQPVVMSSQRFLDDEIVEEKKEEIIAEGIQEVTCPITKAYVQDLAGNDMFILTDKHHTLAAARELNLPIIFEEVENDFTESTDGEEICAEYFMGDNWFYVNHPNIDMIERDVW